MTQPPPPPRQDDLRAFLSATPAVAKTVVISALLLSLNGSAVLATDSNLDRIGEQS